MGFKKYTKLLFTDLLQLRGCSHYKCSCSLGLQVGGRGDRCLWIFSDWKSPIEAFLTLVPRFLLMKLVCKRGSQCWKFWKFPGSPVCDLSGNLSKLPGSPPGLHWPLQFLPVWITCQFLYWYVCLTPTVLLISLRTLFLCFLSLFIKLWYFCRDEKFLCLHLLQGMENK